MLLLQMKIVYAMEALLAATGIVEFGLCMWGSVICCATSGCGCCRRRTTVVATVSCHLFDAHCCHMGTATKHPVPDQVKPSFVIFDIRAL